jgi:hypothetical protein
MSWCLMSHSVAHMSSLYGAHDAVPTNAHFPWLPSHDSHSKTTSNHAHDHQRSPLSIHINALRSDSHCIYALSHRRCSTHNQQLDFFAAYQSWASQHSPLCQHFPPSLPIMYDALMASTHTYWLIAIGINKLVNSRCSLQLSSLIAFWEI